MNKNNAFTDGTLEEGTTKIRSYASKSAFVGQAPNLPARSGVNSFFINGNSGGNFAFLNAVTPVIPGRTYLISFYHKQDTVGTFTGNDTKLWLGGDSYVDLGWALIKNQNWSKREFRWTAPAGATSIQLRFRFYATDYSWMQIDDIEIVEEVSTLNSTSTKTDSYKYDSVWKDKLISFNNNAITYDAIGNPLTYAGYTYTWKQGRQLSTIAGNGLSISYLYNDAGIRTQKTSGGVTTTYHLVGDKVTYEENATDKIYYTYDSASKLISINLSTKNAQTGVWSTPQEYYYIRNAQGDIIGLFDKTGAQVVGYTYDSQEKLIVI